MALMNHDVSNWRRDYNAGGTTGQAGGSTAVRLSVALPRDDAQGASARLISASERSATEWTEIAATVASGSSLGRRQRRRSDVPSRIEWPRHREILCRRSCR